MGLFSRVYQIVLLEVSQLREALIASLAFKRSLPAVYSEVHLGRSKAIIKQKRFWTVPEASRRLPLPSYNVCLCTHAFLLGMLYQGQADSSLPFQKAGVSFSTAYLEIGELAEGLGANVALVLDLPVLLLQGVWEGFVSGHIPLAFDEIHGFFAAGGSQHH